MLDDLLGRTELKEEIEALTEELEHLERQLEAEQGRRKDAVTERQRAERQVNRLEDRVEELEDRVERLQSRDTDVSFRRETTLDSRRLDEILDRLDSFETGPEGALTAFVEDGHDLPAEIRDVFGERAPLVSRAAPCLVVSDDAGLITACLRPPISPDPFVEWADEFRLDRSWVQPQGRYTLALVRSDLFAMGTYEGSERVAFHGFDSDLKSQHSKGGFSQSRFERLRDEQIGEHLDRCREALDQREVDPLYLVGERSVLSAFRELAAETSAVDATGDPESALRSAYEEFWTVQLRIF